MDSAFHASAWESRLGGAPGSDAYLIVDISSSAGNDVFKNIRRLKKFLSRIAKKRFPHPVYLTVVYFNHALIFDKELYHIDTGDIGDVYGREFPDFSGATDLTQPLAWAAGNGLFRADLRRLKNDPAYRPVVYLMTDGMLDAGEASAAAGTWTFDPARQEAYEKRFEAFAGRLRDLQRGGQIRLIVFGTSSAEKSKWLQRLSDDPASLFSPEEKVLRFTELFAPAPVEAPALDYKKESEYLRAFFYDKEE